MLYPLSHRATLCYNYTMKLLRKKEQKKTEQERVEERREEVLAAGRKFMKVYRQMKMYNDPETNPVLYAKK